MKSFRFLYHSIRARLELARYNDFTIAEYFRKQGARVGKDCRIQIRGLGSEPFLISIGNHCTIAGGVAFATHDGAAWLFSAEDPTLQRFGRIEVLDNCFIGMGAILLPGIRIGPNSVVGAGSVVTRDVPPGMVVAKNPAVPVSTIENYREKLVRLWATQRPEGYLNDLRPGEPYTAEQIQRRKIEEMGLLRRHLERIL